MALPQWPSTLPTTPLRDGTSIDSLRQKPIETTMEDGTRRQRKRSTTPLSEVTLQFFLRADQITTFREFVTDTLPDGVGRFEMPVWEPGAAQPYPVRVAQIFGGASAVKIRNVGRHYYVTIPLYVRDYL